MDRNLSLKCYKYTKNLSKTFFGKNILLHPTVKSYVNKGSKKNCKRMVLNWK